MNYFQEIKTVFTATFLAFYKYKIEEQVILTHLL